MTSDNNNDNNKLQPTTTQNTLTQTPVKKGTISIKKSLHDRLRSPNTMSANAADPLKMPNRIALLLDVSGSMSGSRIESLRNACVGFINACNFADTSLALEPFGEGCPPPNRLDLTCFAPILVSTVQMLNASGGTPMAQALTYVLSNLSLTRCVLVSDGQPDNEDHVYNIARQYKAAELPCDCVHISESHSGEACLRHVAEMTGGQYIKFTDIQSFAKSFKYLTPAYYAQLTSGWLDADALGATEIGGDRK